MAKKKKKVGKYEGGGNLMFDPNNLQQLFEYIKSQVDAGRANDPTNPQPINVNPLGNIKSVNSINPQAVDLGQPKDIRVDTTAADAMTKLRGKMSGLPDASTGLGALLSQVSMSEDGTSNVGVGTAGGALQGLGMGAKLGPLGAIGGAILGGVSGFAGANQRNADFYDSKAVRELLNMSGKTVSPSTFSPGGFVGDGEQEFLPVQMELDENYITPEMDIYASKATKEHEDMDDDEITDVVQTESFVFSNRKDFSPKSVADEVLGYGYAYYNEDGTHALEKIKMSDYFGDSKKKISFAKAIDMVKKKLPTVDGDDNNADIFTRITNDENKQARMFIANKLIQYHEDGEFEEVDPLIPQQYGKGGPVRKMEVGGGLQKSYLEFFKGLDTLDLDSNKTDQDLISILRNLTKPASTTTGNNQIRNPQTLDQQYNDLFGRITDRENLNQTEFDRTTQDTADLFGRINTRSAVGGLTNLLATGLQSTRVDPKLVNTSFADEMFEEISPAVADQLDSNQFGRANSMVANIATVSPMAAAQAAPNLLATSLDASNRNQMNILTNNLAQRRGRYSYLTQARDANRAETIRADEETRNLINKQRANMASGVNEVLTNRNTTDIQEFALDRSNRGRFNQNNDVLFQNRVDLTASRGGLDLQRDYLNERLGYISKSLAPVTPSVPRPSINESLGRIDTSPLPSLGGIRPLPTTNPILPRNNFGQQLTPDQLYDLYMMEQN